MLHEEMKWLVLYLVGSEEMSESRKLLGKGREQRPECKGKKKQDHSKDKPQCHNYL